MTDPAPPAGDHVPSTSPPGAAPRSRRGVRERHPTARPWANIVVPILVVLLLGGLGASIWAGRGRGGFGPVPTRAEQRQSLCRSNLESLWVAWRNEGAIPARLWHERWGGQDGLACANDDGAPYAVRDLARCPADPARAEAEPLAACLGVPAGSERWKPPHGNAVLVLYCDGTVRELDWDDVGLPEPSPGGAAPPVVGPDSSSAILRVMRPAH